MYGCACLGLVLCSLENKQAGFAVAPSTLVRLFSSLRNIKMSKWMFWEELPVFLYSILLLLFAVGLDEKTFKQFHCQWLNSTSFKNTALSEPLVLMWDNLNWEVTEGKELKPSLVGDTSVPRGDDKACVGILVGSYLQPPHLLRGVLVMHRWCWHCVIMRIRMWVKRIPVFSGL